MAYLTVYNKQAPWKKLVIQLNVLQYYDGNFHGDEGYLLYAKADGAETSEGEEVPIEIIGARTRTVKSHFSFGWSVVP